MHANLLLQLRCGAPHNAASDQRLSLLYPGQNKGLHALIFLHLPLCLFQRKKKKKAKVLLKNETQAQSLAHAITSGTSHLLQPVGSVLNLLQRVALQLRQLGYGVAELLAQQRVLLPKLLHRNSDLGQRATAAFALFTQSLEDSEREEEHTRGEATGKRSG